VTAPQVGRPVAYYGTDTDGLTDPHYLLVMEVYDGGFVSLMPMARMDPPPNLPARVPFSEEPALGHWTWRRPPTPEPDVP
jgi:hypothetical protein